MLKVLFLFELIFVEIEQKLIDAIDAIDSMDTVDTIHSMDIVICIEAWVCCNRYSKINLLISAYCLLNTEH